MDEIESKYRDLESAIKLLFYGKSEINNLEFLPGKADVLVCAALEWCKNRHVYLDTDPDVFCRNVYHAKNKMPLLWRTYEDFKLTFKSGRETKLRNLLFTGGLSVDDAESFICWIAKKEVDFLPVDIKLLGDLPTFTLEFDRELLNAVFKQEGLFMQESFIKWDIIALNCHVEHLKYRFRYYKSNWEELEFFFDWKDLIQQYYWSICRKQNENPGNMETLDFKKCLRIIQDDIDFVGDNYYYWIRLAKYICHLKMGTAIDILEFKKSVEMVALTLHPTERTCLFKTKLKVCKTNETIQVHGRTVEQIIDYLLENGVESLPKRMLLTAIYMEKEKKICLDKIWHETKTSVCKTLPLILGPFNNTQDVMLSSFDAFTFQRIEIWESNRSPEEKQKFYQKFVHLAQPRNRRLSITEIASLVDKNVPQLKEQKEIDKGDWIKMITTAYNFNYRDVLYLDETWDDIIYFSKVNITERRQKIRLQFYNKILPNLKEYSDNMNLLNYFKQTSTKNSDWLWLGYHP